MSLYNLLSEEQLDIKIIIKKNVRTVFDLSYLLVDLQSVVNGLTELTSNMNQWDELDEVASFMPMTEDKNKDLLISEDDTHPQWQKEVEKNLKSILYFDSMEVAKRPKIVREGFKKTTSRRFNEKYKMNLALIDFQKGSLILEILTPILTGLIIEFIKEIIFKKTGEQNAVQVNITNNYISISESDIKNIEKINCISDAIVINEGVSTRAIDTKALINNVVQSARPDENIEESVKRLLKVLEENGIIDGSELYDKRGVKTFVKDTDRLIGNLLNIRA